MPVPIVGTPSPPPSLAPTPEKVRASVSGGGWIFSPVGAYGADPALDGKATLGFVVRSKEGPGNLTGSLEFHLNAAKLHLHAASFELLEIQGGRATFHGTGTLKIAAAKGDLDERGGKDKEDKQGCGFLVTIVDGQFGDGEGPDLFRIKIWDLDSANTILYDSQVCDLDSADPTTRLEGGSIAIHSGDQNAHRRLESFLTVCRTRWCPGRGATGAFWGIRGLRPGACSSFARPILGGHALPCVSGG